MNKLSIKKVYDTDLIGKITELSKIVNNEDSDVKEIKNAISEMKTIVNHAGLIFQTTQDIFNKTFKNLSSKVDKLNNEIDDDEYSATRIKFMHKTYELKVENESDLSIIDHDVSKIELTPILKIPQTTWLKIVHPETITLCLGRLIITTTMDELKKITFDYSSNILKPTHKNRRHLGPLQSLDNDVIRLRNHPDLFRIEQNKIKSHIVYNLLLYLALELKLN